MSTWGIILAAGASSRFGSPKALANWHSETLLSHALTTMTPVVAKNLIVVTGAYRDQVANELPEGLEVFNKDWEQGLGISIATGTRHIIKQDRAVTCIIILPVDQPFATSGHLLRLSNEAVATNKPILTSDGSLVGPPAAIPRNNFSAFISLSGDAGLKRALGASEYATLAGPGILRDIDTVENLEQFRET